MKVGEIRKLLTGPEGSAEAAGLVYTDDAGTGIVRERSGDSFRYRDEEGHLVKDGETIARIESLAIPPAYRDVWICPDPAGHLQATGRDDRGRKQYRYHPAFLAARAGNKFARMVLFGRALPKIRARVEEDLKGKGLSRERVLAVVVRLLDKTHIRVGNEEYERENGSLGLTTMHAENVDVHGSELRFHFRGKSGKDHEIGLKDARLAKLIHQMEELPGQHLFRYKDGDGTLHDVTSADVNAYLDEIAGDHFTAKDFRTWEGTLRAAQILRDMDPPVSKKAMNEAVKAVAKNLGNTPAVCRKSYIHPAILQGAAAGELLASFARRTPPDERADEGALLRMLSAKLDTTVESR